MLCWYFLLYIVFILFIYSYSTLWVCYALGITLFGSDLCLYMLSWVCVIALPSFYPFQNNFPGAPRVLFVYMYVCFNKENKLGRKEVEMLEIVIFQQWASATLPNLFKVLTYSDWQDYPVQSVTVLFPPFCCRTRWGPAPTHGAQKTWLWHHGQTH